MSLTFRTFTAVEHYTGSRHEKDRERDGTNVVNRQKALDLSLRVQWTERTSVTLSVPWLIGSWSLPAPTGLGPGEKPGPRQRQDSSGMGDLGLSLRTWLLDPVENPRGNFRVGFGLEAPTGRENVTDRYRDALGTNPRRRPVDASIQPGDGGWGGLLELHAFRDFAVGPSERNVRLYATAAWLAQPRETNRTPSIATALYGPARVPERVRFNSVPDLYRVEAGAAMDLGAGFGAGLGFRVDGVPKRDVIGGDGGFRRPGYSLALVPTVSWSTGDTTLSLSVPRTHHVRRDRNAFGDAGDATFADWSLLFTVSVRF